MSSIVIFVLALFNSCFRNEISAASGDRARTGCLFFLTLFCLCGSASGFCTTLGTGWTALGVEGVLLRFVLEVVESNVADGAGVACGALVLLGPEMDVLVVFV